jgi:hypothetical protein
LLGLGEDRLSIYLNDHLAGATAGVSLARRAAASNRATGYGDVLEEIAGLRDVDLAALLERAQSQRRRLERQRVRAADEALT